MGGGARSEGGRLHFRSDGEQLESSYECSGMGGVSGVVRGRGSHRYSVYLLYWYKSANTDAAGREVCAGVTVEEVPIGTQFACFTSTEVQILTPEVLGVCGGF